MHQLLQYILDFDVYLAQLIDMLGLWAYGAIFATIFCETGLVVAPFLPGESLLITSGTLAGAGVLDVRVLAVLLFFAVFLGDICNYLIGRWFGARLLSRPRRYLRPEHIEQARRFYDRHGAMAIVLSRYLPIVRTLAPFVAGVSRMPLPRFTAFAAVAAATWVTVFFGAGYLFGNVPWVKDYLAVALAVAVVLSATPGFVLGFVHWLRARREAAAAEPGEGRAPAEGAGVAPGLE